MFKNVEVQKSNIDASVNFISREQKQGLIEARFVQRTDDYFIVYLSSQTACLQACRMCFLTQMGETSYEDVTPRDFLAQARTVLEYYDASGVDAPMVHFNFMARGEPLDNPMMIDDSASILGPLAEEAELRGLEYKFLISTILPTSMSGKRLTDIFPDERLQPELYYSIYSVNPKFRKRWLPRSLPVQESLGMLKQWQDETGKIPKIHFAFIKGENDSEQDVIAMCEAINEVELKVNFNIVRYNPYSEKQGEESDKEVIDRNVAIMERMLKPQNSRIVPRVGKDVAASCGMFVQ